MSTQSLKVWPEESNRDSASNSGVVRVIGDTIDDVQSNSAQQLALSYAQQLGIYRPGLGINPSFYRINERNETAKTFSKSDRWVGEYEVTGGL